MQPAQAVLALLLEHDHPLAGIAQLAGGYEAGQTDSDNDCIRSHDHRIGGTPSIRSIPTRRRRTVALVNNPHTTDVRQLGWPFAQMACTARTRPPTDPENGANSHALPVELAEAVTEPWTLVPDPNRTLSPPPMPLQSFLVGTDVEGASAFEQRAKP